MCQRASPSVPSATARSMNRVARATPSRAMASAGGFTRGARKVSMQCVRASIPVAAVRPRGRPSVRSGSQMATRGIMWGARNASFRPSRSVSRAARPTSLPVPAVVGMATTGATSAVILSTPPSMAAYRSKGGS